MPPGRYVLALLAFKRRQARSGFDRLSMLWRAVGGEHDGCEIWTSQSLDRTSPGVRTRWRLLCEGLGLHSAIDPGQRVSLTANQGDQRIRRDMVGRCLVAEITRKRRGEYTDHDLSRIISPDLWTVAELHSAHGFKFEPARLDSVVDDLHESEETRWSP